jgi:hypothetical protein
LPEPSDRPQPEATTSSSPDDLEAVLPDLSDPVGELLELERVSVDDDQVGELARSDRTEIVLQAEKLGSARGGGNERLLGA